MATILYPGGTQQEVQPHNSTDFKVDQLQAIVGGHFEIIPCKDGRIIVANEESKLLDLPRNEQATALVGFLSPAEIRARLAELEAQGVDVFYGSDLDEPDYIAGTVLVCQSSEVK